jgi:hypothetical protein
MNRLIKLTLCDNKNNPDAYVGSNFIKRVIPNGERTMVVIAGRDADDVIVVDEQPWEIVRDMNNAVNVDVHGTIVTERP